MADPAACQYIPQADGSILSSTGQYHGLGKEAQRKLITGNVPLLTKVSLSHYCSRSQTLQPHHRPLT